MMTAEGGMIVTNKEEYDVAATIPPAWDVWFRQI